MTAMMKYFLNISALHGFFIKYHMLFSNQKEWKRMILKELLGCIGENVSVGTPVYMRLLLQYLFGK